MKRAPSVATAENTENIEKFIGTGYDMVKLVGNNLTTIVAIGNSLTVLQAVYDALPDLLEPTIAEITGLTAELASKLTADSDLSWGKLTGVPATFVATAHAHEISDIVGLVDALVAGGNSWGSITGSLATQADLVAALGLKADISSLGTAAEASTADFATAAQGLLAGSALQAGAQIPWTDITSKPTFAAVATSGSASDLSTGTLPAARFDDTAHGSRGGGTLHPVAIAAGAAGFMSGADKTKLDAISGTNTGDQTSIAGITGTKAQFDAAVTDGNFLYVGDAPTAHTHLLAAGATDVTITAANLNALDDGLDTALHFHAADRARANHTGTQLAATISDFSTAVALVPVVVANTAKPTVGLAIALRFGAFIN